MLSPIELDLLLPQHLIEVEGVLGASGMSHHLVVVLLLSSLSLGPLGSRSALTLVRAFSKIPTFSSHAASASSLCVGSSSNVRSSSCNSVAATAAGVAVVGLGGRGGGRGL
jgi:hypothetical protein